MSLWLNDDELIELTGYRQREKQKRALAELRVQFRIRPADGFPLVARAQFGAERLTGTSRRREPDWSSLPRGN